MDGEPTEGWRSRVPKRIPKKVTATMVAGLAAVGVAAKFDGEPSGTRKSYHVPAELQQDDIRAEFNIVTFNAGREITEHIAEISRLAERDHIDAFAFQEVTVEDYEEMKRAFPTWNMEYVLGDAHARLPKGPLGDMLMTRQAMRDVETFKIAGYSKWERLASVTTETMNELKDIPADGVQFDEVAAANQQDRGIQFAKVQIWDADAGEKKDLLLVNTHLAGGRRVHDRQMETATKLIKERLKRGMPAMIAGDFNAYRGEISEEFLRIGVRVNLTDREIIYGNPFKADGTPRHQTDYVADDPEEVLEPPKVKVLKIHSDHAGQEYRFTTDSLYQ